MLKYYLINIFLILIYKINKQIHIYMENIEKRNINSEKYKNAEKIFHLKDE